MNRLQEATAKLTLKNGSRRKKSAPSTNGDNGAHEAPSTNGDNGRDAQGRFTKGNAGGPGNPFARQVAGFRSALCSALTEADLRLLARRVLAEAMTGNLAAARLLFLYAVGKPAEAVDPDRLYQDEWQLYRETPVREEDLTAIVQSMPVEMACKIVRPVLPALIKCHLRDMGNAPKEEGSAASGQTR